MGMTSMGWWMLGVASMKEWMHGNGFDGRFASWKMTSIEFSQAGTVPSFSAWFFGRWLRDRRYRWN
jgi:hypothetical protein